MTLSKDKFDLIFEYIELIAVSNEIKNKKNSDDPRVKMVLARLRAEREELSIRIRIEELESILKTPITDRMVYVMELARLKGSLS